MNRVNSRNDFGHDDSTISIVVVIIIIITIIYRSWFLRQPAEVARCQRTWVSVCTLALHLDIHYIHTPNIPAVRSSVATDKEARRPKFEMSECTREQVATVKVATNRIAATAHIDHSDGSFEWRVINRLA